jgi:hypothetical protein
MRNFMSGEGLNTFIVIIFISLWRLVTVILQHSALIVLIVREHIVIVLVSVVIFASSVRTNSIAMTMEFARIPVLLVLFRHRHQRRCNVEWWRQTVLVLLALSLIVPILLIRVLARMVS